MALPYFIVDAFTNEAFSGNPAAVVPLMKWPADHWLQQVALEMNHPETAFYIPEKSGFQLRWFTPEMEVDLCGHATIATAKVLAHLGCLADGDIVSFSTLGGTLRAQRDGSRFQLDFPSLPQKPCLAPANLTEGLGIKPIYIGKNSMDYLVEADCASTVRALRPDWVKLASISCRGIIVTAPGDLPDIDCVSRFFAPATGVNEDPVTGSAHCCLAEYWSLKLKKARLRGYQASTRGGLVCMEFCGARVILEGDAVLVAEGHLLVDSPGMNRQDLNTAFT